MANKFKVGDIVRLKTGSHSMTVKGNATKLGEKAPISIPDKYECMWSDGKKSQIAVFREDVLQLI
jgi:uncharacterized protein YodC (DUF2158 family)